MFKICSKTFFLVFWFNSGVKEGTCCQNGKMGSVLTIYGQTVKILLESPGKLRIYPVLSLFFHLSPLKLERLIHIKVIFLKLTRTDLLLHNV